MDKVTSWETFVGELSRARSLSFGGGGHVRKPMAAVCAAAASEEGPFDLKILLGGPDVDVLVARQKVGTLHFAYVGMGPLGLAPNFRRAREGDALRVVEASEYLVLAGLEAAARGVPFMPTRAGLGTDLLTRPDTPFREFSCPLTDQRLVAVPALEIDLAVIHVNVADRRGNSLVVGDVFADHLLARAARSVWVTAEKVVDELPSLDSRPAGTFISRIWVDGVIHAPGGADFTGIYPDYPVDEMAALTYAAKAADEDWLASYVERTLASTTTGAMA